MSEDVWSARDTSPSAIEAALRNLLSRRYQEDRTFVPARVMNLVVIVDRAHRGEVDNRLARVGRYHPSRLVIVAVEEGRTQIDASATVASEDAVHQPGHIAVGRERVEVDLGTQLLDSLDTIVDPLLVTDLTTMVWAPHGHAEGVDALRRLANIVLVDTQDEPEPRLAFERAADLTRSAYVVDLAWLRSTPWRERVAAAFDPPAMRAALDSIEQVEVRHRPDSTAAGILFCGWLSTRLGWRPEALAREGELLTGHARARAKRGVAPAAPAGDGLPRARRRDDHDGRGRVRGAGSRTGRPAGRAPGPRRRGARLDGHGRLARRGRDPGRGRAPGAAARPDVQTGARGG